MHDQLAFTRQCVESIRARTPEQYELIFIDNGSTDGTVEWLKGQGRRAEGGEPDGPQRVIVAANAGNRGFPAAAKQELRAASGRQILVLNNDTIVTAGWLGRMLLVLHSHQAIRLI